MSISNYTYLFAFGLFTSTVSSSYYVVSGMIMNELGRMRKEAVRADFRYSPGVRLEGPSNSQKASVSVLCVRVKICLDTVSHHQAVCFHFRNDEHL
jgi:hypothetical protein